jgi:hypothetical protein
VTATRAAATLVLLAALAAVGLPGCNDDGSAAEPDPPAAAKVPRSKRSHVVVVVMENKERQQVIGSSAAPYVNRLARRYALPRRMYGVAHPSMPNYLALIAGSTFGVHSNCTGCTQRGRTLVDQLETAHVSWRAYMEGMPKACFTGAFAGRYAKKHNPFVYFPRVIQRPRRCRKVVPASRLNRDQLKGRLPDFAFLTPDLCNDTHDCSVAHGDSYLSKRIPPLLRQLGPHGFLVLTYDEGDSDAGCCNGLAHGGLIPTVVAGPDVRRGARPRGAYSLYSVLRTVEDAYGFKRLRNAGARGTRSLRAAFRRRPRLR